MATIFFLAVVAIAAAIAFTDWRRGWYAAIIIGILQDPARKLTPGTPPIMVLTIMVVYAAIVVGAAPRLRNAGTELRRDYPRLYQLFQIFIFFLLLAAVHGLLTFGLQQWKAPALGLFIYCAPIPAVILGYLFVRNDEDLIRFFRFYCVITGIALISVPLEYLRVNLPVLGTVALGQDWIRHLPGIQVRILSGIYRSPDIMAWHAAMLSIIALTLAVRSGISRSWFHLALFGWGFLNCLLSGRRKMLYMVVVFLLVFLWKYWRRFSVVQLLSLALSLLMMWGVVRQLARASEQSQMYTAGARVRRGEIWQRLEGGVIGAFQQHGIWGAGLGAATQGARHVVSSESLGWQEGGAGKLALELGLLGFIFAIVAAFSLARMLMRIAYARDATGGLHLIRVALLAMLAANAASFLVSHQPYSDGVLILTNAFLLGALLKMPRASGDTAETAPAQFAATAPLRPMRPVVTTQRTVSH